MAKYFALKPNVTDAVDLLRDKVVNFADYGSCVKEPKHGWLVYGWIDTSCSVKDTDVDNLVLALDK